MVELNVSLTSCLAGAAVADLAPARDLGNDLDRADVDCDCCPGVQTTGPDHHSLESHGLHSKSHGVARKLNHVNIHGDDITDTHTSRVIRVRDITDIELDMFFEQPKTGKFRGYTDYIGRGEDIFKKIRVNIRFVAYHTKYFKIW